MEIAPERWGRQRFLLYLPNSWLTPFHNRSPWLMLPRSFRALGYDATLICARLTTDCPNGVELVQTGLVIKTQGPLLRRGLFRSLFEPLFAIRVIARRRPNLVVISPARSSLITFLAMLPLYRRAISRSTRFILKADISIDDTALDPLIVLLSNALLAFASHLLDMVSFETSCSVERAQRLPGMARSKVVHVPIGFPQGLITLRTHCGIPRDPVILCVARIARMKGQDVLLRAFSKLAARFPQWSVHLIGPEEDQPFKQELLSYIASQHLEDRVAFLGFVDDRTMDEEFARATIFCLPSVHSENAGQVRYEATASGLPVVTTDVPCGRDALNMGWAVVRAGDAESLAGQLEILMRDRSTRQALVERAQSRQISYEGVASLYLQGLSLLAIDAPGSPPGK